MSAERAERDFVPQQVPPEDGFEQTDRQPEAEPDSLSQATGPDLIAYLVGLRLAKWRNRSARDEVFGK